MRAALGEINRYPDGASFELCRRIAARHQVTADQVFPASGSVEVLNLLGTKYLNLVPAGSGQMDAGSTIPESRTRTTYDVVSTLDRLTTTTEQLDTDQLATALHTLAGTLDASAPEVHESFAGISRLSASIATRNPEVEALIRHADGVTKLLADRKGEVRGFQARKLHDYDPLQAATPPPPAPGRAAASPARSPPPAPIAPRDRGRRRAYGLLRCGDRVEGGRTDLRGGVGAQGAQVGAEVARQLRAGQGELDGGLQPAHRRAGVVAGALELIGEDGLLGHERLDGIRELDLDTGAALRLLELVEDLGRQDGRDSSASSRPPSSDSPYKKKGADRSLRERGKRRPGKQPGEPGTTMSLVDDPDERFEFPPAACCGCGAGLAGAPVTAQRRHQVTDIAPAPAPKVTEYVAQAKECPGCGTVTEGELPAHVRARASFGPETCAQAANLTAGHHIPVYRSTLLLCQLAGVAVSTGWMAGIRGRAARQVEASGFMDRVRDLLKTAPAVHADETPARVAGGTRYVHLARTPSPACMHTRDPAAGPIDAGAGLPGHPGGTVRGRHARDGPLPDSPPPRGAPPRPAWPSPSRTFRARSAIPACCAQIPACQNAPEGSRPSRRALSTSHFEPHPPFRAP